MPREARKIKWDRENAWRYRDNCPQCGNEKHVRSKLCKSCAARKQYQRNKEAMRQGFDRWREQNPEDWQRIRKWLASGRSTY